MAKILGIVLILLLPNLRATAQTVDWERISDAPRMATVIAYTSSDRLLAGSFDSLMVSVDRGETWVATGPRRVHAILDLPSGDIIVSGHHGIHLSRDGGMTWVQTQPALWSDRCVLVGYYFLSLGSDGIIWTGGQREYGGGGACKAGGVIAVSEDGGGTWETVNVALEGLDLWGGIAIEDGRLVASTGERSFYYFHASGEFDGWVRLEQRGQGRTFVRTLDGTLFVSRFYASGFGIARSDDEGETWSLPETPFHDLSDLASGPDGILIGAFWGRFEYSGGVFRSLDRGETWQDISAGIDGEVVSARAVAIAPDGFTWVVTDEAIYRSTQPVAISVGPGSEIVGNLRLLAPYPNPARGSTSIPFELDRSSFVIMRAHDVTGREVATVLATTLPAGHHSGTWNTSGLPSGVYFLRLETPEGAVAVRRVVVVR
jgi:hypothetical protein